MINALESSSTQVFGSDCSGASLSFSSLANSPEKSNSILLEKLASTETRILPPCSCRFLSDSLYHSVKDVFNSASARYAMEMFDASDLADSGFLPLSDISLLLKEMKCVDGIDKFVGESPLSGSVDRNGEPCVDQISFVVWYLSYKNCDHVAKHGMISSTPSPPRLSKHAVHMSSPTTFGLKCFACRASKDLQNKHFSTGSPSVKDLIGFVSDLPSGTKIKDFVKKKISVPDLLLAAQIEQSAAIENIKIEHVSRSRKCSSCLKPSPVSDQSGGFDN
uniref:Uncharacterized protein n=1 Tax=Proboscia inermis TaxID=420281 RepID=A0A7S0GBN3_9STRA|mmetsp:Transcript_17863/g.18082  ORF Transcript_17863/g.18082 Transcript_17863/m.18082 type:complete len:277 (+) Transcript_17863:3-833(+)